MKRINKRLILYILIISFSLTLSLVSGVLAKYVKDIDSQTVIKPNDFHFYSSYEDNETYDIYDNQIIINIKNEYLGKATKEDINYKIKINGEEVVNDGILKGNESSLKTHELAVEYDKTYVIVIESTSPFKKTITHTFKTHSAVIDSKYTITNNVDWIEVDLYIGTTCPSQIEITIPSGLLPDNTNPLMDDWYGTLGIILGSEITANAHYNLVFFKADFHDYHNVVDGNFIISGGTYSLTIN